MVSAPEYAVEQFEFVFGRHGGQIFELCDGRFFPAHVELYISAVRPVKYERGEVGVVRLVVDEFADEQGVHVVGGFKSRLDFKAVPVKEDKLYRYHRKKQRARTYERVPALVPRGGVNCRAACITARIGKCGERPAESRRSDCGKCGKHYRDPCRGTRFFHHISPVTKFAAQKRNFVCPLRKRSFLAPLWRFSKRIRRCCPFSPRRAPRRK